MKTVEVLHPAGQWVEVLRSQHEAEINAYLRRYVLDMGLTARVIEQR